MRVQVQGAHGRADGARRGVGMGGWGVSVWGVWGVWGVGGGRVGGGGCEPPTTAHTSQLTCERIVLQVGCLCVV